MSKDILRLSKLPNSVLSYSEIFSVIKANSDDYKRRKIDVYTKEWILVRIVKWFYHLNWVKYDRFELANKIYSPSYISLFSALYEYWMIFQLPESIFLIYIKTFEKKIDNFNLVTKRLKENILLNTKWLIYSWNYIIASPERALLDTIYFYWKVHIDNLEIINWEKIIILAVIYNKKTQKIIKSYFPN